MFRRRSFSGAVLLSLLAVGACATSTPPERSGAEAAELILHAYDLPAMLRHVAPIINDSLIVNLPADVSPAERSRLRESVIRAYGAETLAADLVRRLHESAGRAERPDLLSRAAQMLDSPLARKMIAHEQSAASDDFARRFQRFLEKPVRPEDEPRLKLARDLVAEMRLVELQVEFNVAMLQGTVAARNAAVPDGQQTSDANLKHMETQTRDRLRQRLQRQLPVMLFYAYREVDDEALRGYERLQTSPPLHWVNAALPELLAQSLSTASKRFSHHYRYLGATAQ